MKNFCDVYTGDLRLALGILSGRIKDIDIDQYATLGYDAYKFSAFGKPDENELRSRAEDIVFDAIMIAYHNNSDQQ